MKYRMSVKKSRVLICKPDTTSQPEHSVLLLRTMIQGHNLPLRWYAYLIDDKYPVLSGKGERIMVHHPVRSSRIASIAYDERSATLEIRFIDRRTLQYQRVPARIYNDFLQVVSKGRFYDGVVKGKFTEVNV